MRILVFSHISEFIGGAEKSLIDVVDYWVSKYSVEPVFIIRKPVGSLANIIRKRNWKYHVLEYTYWSETYPPDTLNKEYIAILRNSKAVLNTENLIKKIKPDVVLTNSVIGPWAAFAAHYQRIPHVWMVREYGDLDHGRTFDIGRKKTLKDVGSLSEIVVANSETLANHLEEYIEKKKIEILYNPFDIEGMNKNAQESVSSPFRYKDSLKFVITGSLTPSKGQLETVEAIGRLAQENINIELCIIGKNGPREYRKKVATLIKNYKLNSRVHLVGHQDNPLAYVRLADVGVMASTREAFGRVTFEYIALGKPVIGADTGATPEIIDDGKSGFLFKQGDAGEMAKKMKEYVSPDLLHKHSEASKQKAQSIVESTYNADALYRKIEALPTQPSKEPINYFHRWIEFPILANDYINETKQTSAKHLIYLRIRARLGKAKRRARSVIKRLVK